MGKTKTTIEHEDTNDVDIRVNKKKGLIKEFSMVGRLNTLLSKKANPRNIDIVDLMNILPPTANNLFKIIKDNMNFKNNEATLDKPIGTERKRRPNATKILKTHDAIKKTGQRSYIVNPYLLIPKIDLQEGILDKWNSIP
jgi:hypothetical protein